MNQRLMLAITLNQQPVGLAILRTMSIDEINAKDQFGRNALMLAAINGRIEIVRALLAMPGIAVNAEDNENKTALMLATENSKNTVRDLLRARSEVRAYSAFAASESSHTASINRSASQSARNLYIMYGTRIQGENLYHILAEIETWANDLNSPEYSIEEKRRIITCVQRLSGFDTIYNDERSNISIHQLLALAWIAIHDDDKRKGNLNDALKIFAEGLLEIQTSDDAHICESGTFNKILEKLTGAHPAVNIIFMTKATASIKAPKLAIREAYKYLDKLASHSTIFNCKSIVKLLIDLKTHDINLIWEHVVDKIKMEMLDEFGRLYGNNIDNADFLAMILATRELDLDGHKLNSIITAAIKRCLKITVIQIGIILIFLAILYAIINPAILFTLSASIISLGTNIIAIFGIIASPTTAFVTGTVISIGVASLGTCFIYNQAEALIISKATRPMINNP